jgi:hypothetical protein
MSEAASDAVREGLMRGAIGGKLISDRSSTWQPYITQLYFPRTVSAVINQIIVTEGRLRATSSTVSEF